MTTIFVGNLSFNATEDEIRNLFGRYGYVASVQIKTDAQTNRPRGFAFVRMPDSEDAEEAITRLSRATLNGRTLTVNEARSHSGSTETNSGAQQSAHPVSAAEQDRVRRLFEAL